MLRCSACFCPLLPPPLTAPTLAPLSHCTCRKAPRGLARKRAFAFTDRFQALRSGLSRAFVDPCVHISAACVLLGPNTFNPQFALHFDFEGDEGTQPPFQPPKNRPMAYTISQDEIIEAAPVAERALRVDLKQYRSRLEPSVRSLVEKKVGRELINATIKLFGLGRIPKNKIIVLLYAARVDDGADASPSAATAMVDADDAAAATASASASSSASSSSSSSASSSASLEEEGIGPGWQLKRKFTLPCRYIRPKPTKPQQAPLTADDDDDDEGEEGEREGDSDAMDTGADDETDNNEEEDEEENNAAAAPVAPIPAAPVRSTRYRLGTLQVTSTAPLGASADPSSAPASAPASAAALTEVPLASYGWYQWMQPPVGFKGPLPQPPQPKAKKKGILAGFEEEAASAEAAATAL